MLHSFACKNFYSFKDKTEVSFVVGKNAPDSNIYFTTPSGTRLSKIGIVVGANASGKTHLLKVIPFIRWLIIDSFEHNPKHSIPAEPFAFNKKQKQPINSSVVFEVNKTKKIYTYSVSLIEERILEEELKVTSLQKEKKSTKQLFQRVWNKEKEKYEVKDSGFNFSKGIQNSMRQNASILGTAFRFNHPESKAIVDFWEQVNSNIEESGWGGDILNAFYRVKKFESSLQEYNKNETLKKQAEQFIKRFENRFSELHIEDHSDHLLVRSVYSFNDKTYNMKLKYESSGNKQVMSMLADVFNALNAKTADGTDKKNNSVLVVDEFDMSLHPELSEAILSLFKHSEINNNNAQIIFTTHNHLLLNEVDKYNIFIIQKNDKGESEAYRLDDVEGVRLDDNYFNKYIAGVYGGTPDIDA